MHRSPEGSQHEQTVKVAEVVVGMLHEATARFNAEGHFQPQAYIVRIDGTARHFEAESDGFNAEAFAGYIEERIEKEQGVAVPSIAEMWIVDNWDGVSRVSESPDRYEALAATMESPGNQTYLNAWPIRRDADGTARVDGPQLRCPCHSGLFRLRCFWGGNP